MRNKWMRIIPSQSSSSRTEIQQIRWVQDRWQDRTSLNYPEKVSSCQNCLKISTRRTFGFWWPKSVNLWLQLYHHRILDKEPTDELRQNFISDEMQLHTSTRSELNLIKSVIYIYIYNLFYILYFKPYFITILK